MAIMKIICALNVLVCLTVIKTTNGRSSPELELLKQGRYDLKDAMRQQLGGKFKIGINDPYSDTGEYPPRKTEVKPFYMDIYPVTVAQFLSYKLKKPKYKTTAKTTGYSWVLSSLVPENVKKRWASESAEPWWLAVKGAQWDRPEGPGSHIVDRLNYPVVHVSYHDAMAYCMWVGKRLPSEEEWEYAARNNLDGLQYPWGDRFKKRRMNYWQGKFPDQDKGSDGWVGLSPVDAYEPQCNNTNMYDMLGNVWEWTKTRYYVRVVERRLQEEKYVLKGGSYMDSRDGSFNYAVRTSNRMGQEPTYTAHNVGFRCAASAPHLIKKLRRMAETQKTTTQRPPKIHRLTDMYEYKTERLGKLSGRKEEL